MTSSKIKLIQSRPVNKGNIKVRKLIDFPNSSSLGFIIPKHFSDKMGLSVSQFIKCELNKEGNSFTVEGLNLENSQ